ncbi:MAG: baseplate assembly protein [Caulobacteraceae bacterium]|nr:baseplate assembly protein [Caulobacteraceae bacterium]
MLSPSIPVTAVDLSRLPSPEVVETLSFETILAEMVADLQARDPSFSALVESDPAMRILQVAAWRELLIRQRVNDAARGVMVAYAVGGALDHLGALVRVTRLLVTPATDTTPDVYENDADFRRRIVLAPDGFSTAGPEAAYVFHALSADANVLDATAISLTPGVVTVTVMSRLGEGAASGPMLAAVTAALNVKTVRPLTDNVVVQSATVVHYTVSAQIYVFSGPDSALILVNARAGLARYVETCRRLGLDVTDSGLKAALHVEGVQRVILTGWNDVEVDRSQVAVCTSAVVTLAGDAE